MKFLSSRPIYRSDGIFFVQTDIPLSDIINGRKISCAYGQKLISLNNENESTQEIDQEASEGKGQGSGRVERDEGPEGPKTTS